MSTSQVRRVRGVDALRGLAIAGMIFVNSPGAPVWPQLRHRDWNGLTAADVVFPVFLFAMGAALALGRPVTAGRIARRVVVLVALGIAINALSQPSPVRYPGVLQRIALVYLVAVLVVRAGRAVVVATTVALLAAQSVVLLEAGASPGHSLAARVDVAVFGATHLLKPEGFDPEGLLTSMAAVATALIGYLTVSVLMRPDQRRRSGGIVAVAGITAIVGGSWLHHRVPINKQLWSPSFILVTGGIAALLLVALAALDDLPALRLAVSPLVVLGANALLLFVLSELVELAFLRAKTIDGTCTPAACRIVDGHTWLFEHLFRTWAGERLGALAFSAALVAVLWLVAAVLWRARLFLRA